MLPALIQEGQLRALLASPPLFYQDGYFGTDAGRVVNADNTTAADIGGESAPQPRHFIYLPPCKELDDANMSLIRSPLSVFRGREDEAFVDELGETRRVEVPGAASDLLTRGNVPVQGPEQQAYLSQHGGALVVRPPPLANGAAGIIYSQAVDRAGAASSSTSCSGWPWRHARGASLDPGSFDVAVGAWRHRC